MKLRRTFFWYRRPKGRNQETMLVDNSVWTYDDLCQKQVRWGRVGTNLNELSWSIGQWFVFLQGIMAFGFHYFDAFGKQLLVEFGRFKQWKHLYPPWNKWMAGIRSFPLGANGLSSERLMLVLGECTYMNQLNGGLEKNIDSSQSYHSVIYFILVGLPTHKLGVPIKGSYQIAFNELPVSDHVCIRLLSW